MSIFSGLFTTIVNAGTIRMIPIINNGLAEVAANKNANINKAETGLRTSDRYEGPW